MTPHKWILSWILGRMRAGTPREEGKGEGGGVCRERGWQTQLSQCSAEAAVDDN